MLKLKKRKNIFFIHINYFIFIYFFFILLKKNYLFSTKSNPKVTTFNKEIERKIDCRFPIEENGFFANTLLITNSATYSPFSNLSRLTYFGSGELIKLEKKIDELEKKIYFYPIKMEDIEKEKLSSYINFLKQKKIYFEQKNNKQNLDLISSKESKITFEDIYGIEKIKIQTIKEQYLSIDNFSLNEPKSILLYGSSGTGKTFLINTLYNEIINDIRNMEKNDKKLNYSRIGFIFLKPLEFIKTFFRNELIDFDIQVKPLLEIIFKKIAKYRRIIIFIDEIDGIKIPNDTQGETKIEDKSEIANLITNFFLNKKEELNNKKSIMLIGTTNNLDKIDKKLKNRFNEEIYVDLLKNEEIEGFLKHILLSYDISYHAFVYLEKLVQFCYNKNYSQRELKNIIEKAYIKSVANQRKNHSIYLSDLKESFEENKK